MNENNHIDPMAYLATDAEIRDAISFFRSAIMRACNLPPESRKVKQANALLPLMKGIAPDLVRNGALDPLFSAYAAQHDDHMASGAGENGNCVTAELAKVIVAAAATVLMNKTGASQRATAQTVSSWTSPDTINMERSTVINWMPDGSQGEREGRPSAHTEAVAVMAAIWDRTTDNLLAENLIKDHVQRVLTRAANVQKMK